MKGEEISYTDASAGTGNDGGIVIASIRNLSKAFPGVQALDNVSLDIKRGEIFGLIGENGAGKSTLVKILSGIYRRDTGEILIGGRPVHPVSPVESQRLGLSFILQERNLAPFLSIQENLFAGRQPVKNLGFIDWKRLRDKAKEILTLLHCTLDPSLQVNRLSVAEQQIVEIGRAISFDSKILVMDEPTASISDEEVEVLFSILRNLKDHGVTIIFISHRLKEVLDITDRIGVLRDGKLVDLRDTASTRVEEIIQLMVGRRVKDIFQEERISPEENIVLSVEDLSCPGIFEPISFEVNRGEILGFAGLVGAGRTELLRAIFGHLNGTRGTIRIAGKVVDYETPLQAMEAGISYLSEDRKGEGIFPFMGVSSNITIASLGDYVKSGFVRRKVEREASSRMVKALDIKTPELTTLLYSLSGGNQQKTIIARGLLREPKIFLLDEPTAGIDVGAKFEIYTILRDLAARGVAILFVSSELNELLGICHRIIVMCQGKVTGEFDARSATQEDIMACATRFE
jgi:ribose transport system ATP-binding protein